MASPYYVSGFDVCIPGFERLRSQNEILLCAYPDGRTGWRKLRDMWIEDFDCAGWEGLDYAAVRRAIYRYCAELRRAWKGRSDPMGAAGQPQEGERLTAYLYITVPYLD